MAASRSGEETSQATIAFLDSDDGEDKAPLSFKRANTTTVKDIPPILNPDIFSHIGDEVPLSFKRASTSMKKRQSLVNPVIFGNDDDEVPLSFKRASTFVKNKPLVVNRVIFGSDDDEVPLSFKRASTSVKNKPSVVNHVMFGNDDDEVPLSFKRASTSVKNTPSVANPVIDNDDDEAPVLSFKQKSEDHAKSGSGNGGSHGGRPKKKHKGTTSIPSTEETMERKALNQGQQYSISRCLAVFHGMDDVSDEIKVLASDVLEDASSREFFLCYESRLRGLWLKKEVAKLGTQLSP